MFRRDLVVGILGDFSLQYNLSCQFYSPFQENKKQSP